LDQRIQPEPPLDRPSEQFVILFSDHGRLAVHGLDAALISTIPADAIAGGDRLRDEFGANVCLIHHVGKDAGRGARGHSSLFAAVDTAIEVTRNDDALLSTARVVKQRFGETHDMPDEILEPRQQRRP